MSRRKLAPPKKLDETQQTKAAWHINLQKNDEIQNVHDLIDDAENDEVNEEVVNDGASPSKIAKSSFGGKFTFNWGGRINQRNFNFRLKHYFIILNNVSTTDKNEICNFIRLGSFKIRILDDECKISAVKRLTNLYLHKTSDDEFLEQNSSSWILFSTNPGKENPESGVLCDVNLNEFEFNALKSADILQPKVFFDCSDDEESLTCIVYLNEKRLKLFNQNKNHLPMKILMKRFLDIDYFCPKNHPKVRENVDEFYRMLQAKRQSMNIGDAGNLDPQHLDLIPILRLYQRRAVQWMIWREKFVDYKNENGLHPYFIEQKIDGRLFFYNPYEGILSAERPPNPYLGLPGGILADEMGLGKTVEILALILLNPKITRKQTNRGGFYSVESVLPDVRDVVEELVSVVSSNVETDLSFSRKLDEQKKRKRDLVKKKKRDYVQISSKRNSIDAKLSCFCGKHDFDEDPSPRIQCQTCASVQHKRCVNWTWQTEDDYLCPHCRVGAEPLESKTTLIISPSSICYQWHQEILKHIRSYALKVYIYQGVQAEGFVQPKALADYDIVITTYETLRNELNYVDMPHFSRLRHPKRFLSAPSPITAVFWWRVCLDEAQMVEGAASKAAAMCIRLPTINRWCITGTPIQKSVDDLFGLWAFLGIEPYCVKDCWRSSLFLPYLYGESENIVDVVAPVLWRTVKIDVLDQLNVPEQQHQLYWLEFGPVEEHFYRRTLEESSKAVNLILNRWIDRSVKLENIDRSSLDKVLRPLLKLRQACCHPQIVRGRFVNLQKNQMSMEEVLENMIKKTKIECEDEHRAVVASHNGMAGLQQLKRDWARSAEIYRQVLQLCDSYIDKIRTDPLPKIHALHNLFELISSHRVDVPPTCRDDQLRAECDELKSKYLLKTLNSLEKFKLELNEIRADVEEHSKKLTKSGETWWIDVCSSFRSSELESEMLDRVQTALSSTKTELGGSLADKFRDLNGLKMVLFNLYDNLKRSRQHLDESLHQLTSKDNSDDLLLNEATFCHLRPKNGINLESCPVCLVDRNFDDYESKLFNFKPFDASRNAPPIEDDETNVPFMAELRRGTWADSPLEQTLKAIHQFASRQESRRYVDQVILESAKDHLKFFDVLKKEFRTFRAVWMAVRDHVALRDELSIAVEKFRFRTPDDDGSTDAHLIDPNQIEFVELKLSSDRVVAEGQLQRKLGQLGYLSGLKNLPIDDETGNPEECPVCRIAFGFRWSLLTCGHTYCCDCVRILCNSQFIKCPICRQTTNRTNISYVTTRRNRQLDEGVDQQVRGSHSTKVESVVKCLMDIRRRESGSAKCLVFSNWKEVLDIVAAALKQNGLEFLTMGLGQNGQKTLNAFKDSTECNILLLPMSSGANGLNIIEATHVLLVDPLLNLAAEQQALGRVHRIGQKKQTTVHKFLIRGTVEEKMHNILGDAKTDRLLCDTESPLIVGDLVNLFQN